MKTEKIVDKKRIVWRFMPPKGSYTLWLVILLSVIFFTNAFAGTKTFSGTGNFGDATKWNGSTLPVAGDNLRIDGNCTVNNSALTDNVAYTTLTIGNGALGSLSWAVGGNNRLNVTSVNSLIAGSSLNMTNGGTLILHGALTSTNLTFTPGLGSLELQSSITLPAAYATFNNLIINGSALSSVTLGVAITVNGNLTVSSGTFNVGGFNLTVTGTTTVNSILNIISTIGTKTFGNLIINGTFNNNTVNELLTITGNFQNNGTYNGGTGYITFTGATSKTISGTAASTAFNGGIVVNKGTSNANVLDVQCVVTIPSGALYLINGTFKLSSASTIDPFPNTAGAIIPATAGLWNNGGTMNSPASMDWTINGYLRCSAGTINIGMIADDYLLPQSGSAITIDGGTVNVAGCMLIFAPAVFTMSGGTMNCGTVGSTVATSLPPFSIGDTLATFNMSAGTIVIVHPCDPGGLNYGFYNLAETYTVTGGTLQIGNGSTNAGEIIRINSTVPLYDLLVNSVNVTARLSPLLTTTIVVDHNVTIAAGILDANDKYLNIAGDWINNGNFLPTTTSVTFNGTGTHTVTGTSTTNFNLLTVDMGTNFTSNILDVLSLITLPAGGLTLTNGTFKLSSNSTLTPFIADITAAPYRVPATAGLWVNGGTISSAVDMTVAGLIRVSNGVLNIGNAADESLLSAWATVIMEGGAFNISGRFAKRIAGEGSYFTMAGGTLTVPTIGSTSATISPFMMDEPGSSFSASGGTIIIERSGAGNLGYVNLAGTINVTDGTLQIGDALTPVTQTMLINSSAPIGNLTVNALNSPIAKLTTNSLTVVNDVTISGGTLHANNLNFTVGGDWTKAIASVYTQGSGTVTFNGTIAQSITGTATTQTFNHIVVSKTAGTTLSVLASTTSLTAQNFTETTGNFTAPATLNINGNLLITTGTFTAGTTINIQGNWTKNGGTFTPGTNIVNFVGTATKTLGGSTQNSFYNLTINTTALTDIVRLTSNTTVTSVLTLTKGVTDLNSRVLTVSSGLNTAITRTSGYILSEKTDNSSKLKWNLGSTLTSHTFPFGTASGSYIPFIMNLTAGNIGNVTVSTYPTASNNTPFPSAPVVVTNVFGSNGVDNSANVVDRFWQIDKEGPSGTATITFNATAAEVGSILAPTAQRYESSTNNWQQAIPGQTITATSATVPGVTTFSPWTMSSKAQMLPIQLVSFTAVYENPFVSLKWVTESEANSDYFTIERTLDERSFETVCQVKAAGESVQKQNYQANDVNPLPGTSYYRLKQSDRDGAVSYSDLVAVEVATRDPITVLPNPPINGVINIQVQNHPGETIHIAVMDLNGKILFAGTNKLSDDQQSYIVIDQLENLHKGLYILRISCASGIYNKRISIY